MARILLCFVALATCFANAARSEVVVRLSTEPLEARATVDGSQAVSPQVDGQGSLLPRGVPTIAWIAPYIVDDTVADGVTTHIGIRNLDPGPDPVELTLEVLDEETLELEEVPLSIPPHALVPLDVRSVPAAFTPGATTRGLLRILDATGPIHVETFDLDFGGDFATGLSSATADDFCTDWIVRFLRFGPPGTPGSTITFVVNGPLGVEGLPTVSGTVYDEDGVLINTFEIYTDDWIFAFDAQNLVAGDVPSGTFELTIDSTVVPRGYVTQSHTALGRFSVGEKGVCVGGEAMM